LPDLFFHFASGYLPTRYPKVLKYDALLVLGAILPDVLTRIPEIVLYRYLDLPVYDFFNALHTPFSLLIFCYCLSLFFVESDRISSFVVMSIGAQFHILLDMMQEQFYSGVYMPMFPFSLKTYQFALFHPHSSLLFSPLLAILCVWACCRRSRRKVGVVAYVRGGNEDKR